MPHKCPYCGSYTLVEHGDGLYYNCSSCERMYSKSYLNGYWAGFSEGWKAAVRRAIEVTRKLAVSEDDE